jgi:hypothetical protein
VVEADVTTKVETLSAGVSFGAKTAADFTAAFCGVT